MLAAFLEMLLPERKITRYVRLVLGLFVVVAILTPLVEWLPYGSSLEVAAWDLRLDAASASTAVQQGLEMAAENENAALQVYRDRLASQIKALVTLVPGVKSAEVLVDVASEHGYRGIIQRVAVVAYLEEPEKQKGGGSTSLIEVERVKVKPEAATGEFPGAYQDKQPLPEEGEKINGIQGGVESPVPDNQLPQVNVPGPEDKNLQAGAATFTPAEVQQIKARIIDMITHFYSLDPGKVEVQVLPQAVNQ